MRRINGFDGIRGIAAVAVVFEHTVAGSTQIGGYAVNVFFALSGFLIITALHQTRMSVETGAQGVWDAVGSFWRRRILRICPAYYVVGFVALAYYLLAGKLLPSQAAAYVVYVQNFMLAFRGDWLPFGYSWTLAAEQQFYFLFAPLILVIASGRHAAFLLFSVVCLAVLYAALLLAGVNGFLVYHLPVLGFMLAAMGGLFGVAPAGRLAGRLTSPPVVAVFLVALLVLAPLPSRFFEAHPVLDFLQIIASVIAIPAVIAAVPRHQGHAVVRFLSRPILVFFGRISYSLYLVQGIVADLVKERWPVLHLGPAPLSFAATRLSLFVCVLIASTVLAWISYEGVEKVFLRLRREPASVDGLRGAAATP